MNTKILKLYFSKNLILIFFMGISSGIPLYLILSTLFIWLTRENIDIATVGLFALTQLPWTLKFIWAPFVDNYNIPLITNYFGQRKSWLLVTQIFLIFSIICLGLSNPTENLFFTAFCSLMVATFSANQDIIIDAYRIEILDDSSQGAGAAMTQFGYRVGGILAGAGALYLREELSWSYVFGFMAFIIFSLMVLTIFIIPSSPIKKFLKKKSSLIDPFLEFITRNPGYKILAIIFFIFFFKFGDVVAGVMANPFYVKIGFSNIEIANASKIFGVFMTLIGVFSGGILVKKIGILDSLLISGFFQIISNLLYVLLASVGPDFNFLMLTVAGENFSGGMGSAAFVAYLSVLCNRSYTGTQYALLSSIMGLTRTVLSSPSGFVVNTIGWSKFFIFSTFLGIPGILILIWMKKRFTLVMQKAS
ncbi:MAG: MFS transporter [Pseudomonadota bacterium]|nr:MFS transporter [Pseudomonadota bacterium]